MDIRVKKEEMRGGGRGGKGRKEGRKELLLPGALGD